MDTSFWTHPSSCSTAISWAISARSLRACARPSMSLYDMARVPPRVSVPGAGLQRRVGCAPGAGVAVHPLGDVTLAGDGRSSPIGGDGHRGTSRVPERLGYRRPDAWM